MNERSPTQLLPALRWQDPRTHPLEDTWLLTLSTILLAVAVPWLLSSVVIDYYAATLGFLALSAIHFGFAGLSRRPSRNPAGRMWSLSALHALGVISVAFIWQHAGGLQNPVLLFAFALPVIGSIFLSRWHPYLMAALAAVIVALVAAAQAPELRWYAVLPGGVVAWLGAFLGRTGARVNPSFASFYAPSAYFVVLLEVFIVMVFACAVAAEYLGNLFERLLAQVAATRAEAVRSQGLWSALVEGLPLPAVLLDADTHEVLCVSAGALTRFFANDETVVGRDLFKALTFSYPEPVERLVNGVGGTERLCMVRLQDALVAAEVRVQHIAYNGRRLALALINDTTEALCMRSALDVAEHAALIADAQGRVLALNKAARAILAGAEVGATVASLAPEGASEPRWWDPGLSGRRKMHVVVARRTYQVTSSAVPLPGEDMPLYVIAFLPAEMAPAIDQTTAGLTATVGRP